MGRFIDCELAEDSQYGLPLKEIKSSQESAVDHVFGLDQAAAFSVLSG